MLQNLSIQDFILIEKLDLDFGGGFSVITGQTGAGKSILLDAILFALGVGSAKSDSGLVRHGQEKAIVTLTFSLDHVSFARVHQCLCEYDLTCYDPQAKVKLDSDPYYELMVKRVQYNNGRRKFFINDQLVTQKIVTEIFGYLLEIHSQQNHTLLLNRSFYLEILDRFADNSPLKNKVANLFQDWQALEAELALLNSKRDHMLQEIDYLSHICQEFEKINPQDGEEEELAEIKKRLQSRDKEIKLIESILNDIETSNLEQIVIKAGRNIARSENAANYSQIQLYLDEIYNKIEETKSKLNNILHDFDLPNHTLADVEDRLYLIRSLARKHNCAPGYLRQFIEECNQKLKILNAQIASGEELQSRICKARKEYELSANCLSKTRQSAAMQLEAKTRQELGRLDMKKAVFSVDIQQKSPTARGIDEVNFLATTNPGSLPAPIDKVASGGELSRFMLAFRSAFADKFTKQTIIFDEIDTGMSGSVADAIGERLKALSKLVQVIVITHQPQVAGKADEHIVVQKLQTDDMTVINLAKLDVKGRAKEIARMISGQKITENALAAAKELMRC